MTKPRYLDLNSPEDRETLAQMIAVGQQKNQLEHPGIRMEFATVTSYGKVDEQLFPTVIVKLAGDPEDHQVECVNLLPSVPDPGDRVSVWFVPPNGIYIVGTVQTRAAPCWAADYIFDTGFTWSSEVRQPMIDIGANLPSLSCGFELVDSGSGNLDTIIVPESGTYVGSFGALMEGGVAPGETNGGTLLLDNVPLTSDDREAFTSSIHLNGRARVFFAERGQELYVEATASDPATITRGSISVWALCCDYRIPTFIPPE